MSPQHALQFLPHGPAFRFVDELTALEPGRSGEARYTVRGDEAFLNGHFPGNPLLPGVILIEALAQLGGVVAQSDPAVPPLPDLRLAAVRDAKITGSAAPGETLWLRAAVDGRLGGLVQISGEIFVEGRTILRARVTLGGAAG